MIGPEKFTYTNPMHKGEEIKKTSSPNEYGDDLAQHYEGLVKPSLFLQHQPNAGT